MYIKPTWEFNRYFLIVNEWITEFVNYLNSHTFYYFYNKQISSYSAISLTHRFIYAKQNKLKNVEYVVFFVKYTTYSTCVIIMFDKKYI